MMTFVSASPGLLFFGFPQLREFSFVCLLFRAHRAGGFATTILFGCAQTHHHSLGFTNLGFGNLTTLILGGAFVGFAFDPFSLMFSAAAGNLFFLFIPARLLGSQHVFRGHAS